MPDVTVREWLSESLLGFSARREQRLSGGVRIALVVLCAGVAAVGDRQVHSGVALGVIVLAGSVTAWRDADPLFGWIWRTAEAATLGVAILGSGGAHSAVLPYLIAVGFAGGLRGGPVGAVSGPGTTALTLLVGRAVWNVPGSLSTFASVAVEWVVLGILAGLVASWLERLLVTAAPIDPEYASAYRLMTQLRTVARNLAGRLDPVTIADSVIAEAQTSLGITAMSIHVRGDSDRLVLLAHKGSGVPTEGVAIGSEGVWYDAWTSQRPAGTTGDDAVTQTLVVPLLLGLRTIGLATVRMEPPSALDDERIRALQRILRDATIRLETSLLFDDLRALATAEERRRLAREIHDGVAQEVAALGYLVDDLAQEAEEGRTSELVPRIRGLRDELTRIVSELRLSIFELRNEIDNRGGLGTALSEYVRSIGASSALRVHLTLEESPGRLRPDVEMELLRIAQEAMTNVRRHASADNLWVTCLIEAPQAVLRIEDDGVGLGKGRQDSFGLHIMRERAHRMHARFDVRAREGGGTSVEVILHPSRSGDNVRITTPTHHE